MNIGSLFVGLLMHVFGCQLPTDFSNSFSRQYQQCNWDASGISHGQEASAKQYWLWPWLIDQIYSLKNLLIMMTDENRFPWTRVPNKMTWDTPSSKWILALERKLHISTCFSPTWWLDIVQLGSVDGHSVGNHLWMHGAISKEMQD